MKCLILTAGLLCALAPVARAYSATDEQIKLIWSQSV